jgi:hypothetical protein
VKFYNFEHQYAHRIQRCTSNLFKPFTFLEAKAFKFVLVSAGINVMIQDLYRVIQNDCQGFNNLSYTIHLR